MPRINNVDFLTLPQQVSKNKKDVESALTQIGGINQNISNLVVGKLSVGFANPNEAVDISQFGVNAFSVTARQEFLQFVLANHQLVDKQNLLLMRINLIGGVVHDVPTDTEYNVLFNITLQQLTNNPNEYYFRAVSNSSDVKFEVYAVYNALTGVWVTQPSVVMLNTISNKTFYADANDISGGVVNIANLVPADVPVEKDDIVLSGSGFYYVDSLQGTNVNLNQNIGFVAPQGALVNDSIIGLDITNPTIKQKVNEIIGVDLLEVPGSFEDIMINLGLTMGLAVQLNSVKIGSVFREHARGSILMKFSNTTGSPISISGVGNLNYVDSLLSSGPIYQTIGPTSTNHSIGQRLSFSNTIVSNNFLSSSIKGIVNDLTINNGEHLFISIILL